MKIVHIESGLGNQMLSYCEYLALKSIHPDEDIYIETTVFDIPEANEVIKQWNGYELERIFGIHAPNVKDLFSKDQWESIMDFLRKSEWWDKNWNYPVYTTYALRNAGLDIRNVRGDFELATSGRNINMKKEYVPTLKDKITDTPIVQWIRRNYRWAIRKRRAKERSKLNTIFYEGTDNIFTGQWLSMKNYGNGMERIEQIVRSTFKFPSFQDTRNEEMAKMLDGCESVAIHARRGDMLGCNGYCYKHGYFKRATKHIRKHVANPVFVFFCDPGSVKWCKENGAIFGLDFSKDKVYFVDWNKGDESFRDMQLMSYCKHAIITNSSFGWWGAFFIQNKNKITIAPKEECLVNTTYHC